MSKCPNCGGELNYSVEDTKVVCPYCKSEFDPKTLETKTHYVKERESFQGKSYNCTQCGATLLTFDETAITFCSYCGSQSIIESKMMKVNNPDYIIPFNVTKEACIKEYKSILDKALFVPSYMKDEMTVEKFRGIFMPYNVYKTSYHGNTSNTGEKYSHRSGDYVIYDKYDVIARVDATYEGVSYDLLSKFYDSYSRSIPFDYRGVVPFNKNYLMGYYADMKDVDEKIYDSEAEKITSDSTTAYMVKRKEFYKYGCRNPRVGLKVEERKTGMFPVYFLATKGKNGNLHYAIINGQTGKVALDLPIDFKKYIFGTLLVASIIFVILYFFDIILPQTVLFFSLIATVISILISNNQLEKIYEKEHNIKDKGVLFKNGPVTQEEFVSSKKKKQKVNKGKSKYLTKLLIVLILGFFVLLSGTIKDEYYYGTSILIFLVIIWSFKDLVDEHNTLASNRPPQLEKRGGEEYGK